VQLPSLVAGGTASYLQTAVLVWKFIHRDAPARTMLSSGQHPWLACQPPGRHLTALTAP